MLNQQVLWTDTLRVLGFPWPFVRYTLTPSRIFVKSGVLFTHYDEVYLFRLIDCRVRVGPLQKLLGLGTVELITSDATSQVVPLRGIRRPLEIKEQISSMIASARKEYGLVEHVGVSRRY